MRFRSLTAVIALAAIVSGRVAVAAPSAIGLWTYLDSKTGKPKATIQVENRNGELIGTVRSVVPPPGAPADPLCDKCEGDMRGKPMIGMVIMRGLHERDGAWEGGRITDTETGTTYRCIVTPEADGDHLRLRGFVGISLFGRTETWVRAKP